MDNLRTIICAFCQGTGKHPHFGSTCPVCKGKGKNNVVGPYMVCKDCRGTGQKRGTTLTCYACNGLGVVPDIREIVKKARREIRKARKEMAKEREEFREKPLTKKAKPRQSLKIRSKKNPTKESDEDSRFCQCCAKKVNRGSTVKVCLKCFRKLREL